MNRGWIEGRDVEGGRCDAWLLVVVAEWAGEGRGSGVMESEGPVDTHVWGSSPSPPWTQGGESLMGFLELRQEPGVYSRVTAGMSIRNSSLFIEVRNLSRYEGQLRNVN